MRINEEREAPADAMVSTRRIAAAKAALFGACELGVNGDFISAHQNVVDQISSSIQSTCMQQVGRSF